jgi:hypothetical protein
MLALPGDTNLASASHGNIGQSSVRGKSNLHFNAPANEKVTSAIYFNMVFFAKTNSTSEAKQPHPFAQPVSEARHKIAHGVSRGKSNERRSAVGAALCRTGESDSQSVAKG